MYAEGAGQQAGGGQQGAGHNLQHGEHLEQGWLTKIFSQPGLCSRNYNYTSLSVLSENYFAPCCTHCMDKNVCHAH